MRHIMNKKIILFLSFVLLLLVISGCAKTASTIESDNEEPTQIVNGNTEQIGTDLEDPSLEELDNIDLSNW
jgi:uncharacterized protein YceK